MITILTLVGRFAVYFYLRLYSFSDFFEGNWPLIMPDVHYYFYIDEFLINLAIIWYFYLYNREEKKKKVRLPEIVV